MAEKTRACIFRIFGEPATDAVIAMDENQRRAASTALIHELCEVYHVQLNEVVYYGSAVGDCGSYHRGEGKLSLNIDYLMTNDPYCIIEYFDSIVHEMRHAVQWSILEGNEFWQTPEETQRNWHSNLLHYIRPDQDRKGYILQPLERDAFTFANYVLRGVN